MSADAIGMTRSQERPARAFNGYFMLLVLVAAFAFGGWLFAADVPPDGSENAAYFAFVAKLDAFGAAAGEQAETTDELDRLSAREREVMRLIARGYAYKEVAAELFISIKTVETHVSAVLRKLQLSSRHELTAWALERKLL